MQKRKAIGQHWRGKQQRMRITSKRITKDTVRQAVPLTDHQIHDRVERRMKQLIENIFP